MLQTENLSAGTAVEGEKVKLFASLYAAVLSSKIFHLNVYSLPSGPGKLVNYVDRAVFSRIRFAAAIPRVPFFCTEQLRV